MTKKIVLGAILGGIVLFVWEFVAHDLLPLGEAGIKALANEQAVMNGLKENVKEPGFYLFPAPEDRPGMTAQQKQEAMRVMEDRWRHGPTGIMVVHPDGAEVMTPRQLATQLGADVLAMLVAAILLAQLPSIGFGRKVLFVMIGSASATGSTSINQRLSQERSEAPQPIIDQYLVNVPHQFYKVYGLGDMYAPKDVTLQEDQRYQNVRIVAVYDTNQIPALKS